MVDFSQDFVFGAELNAWSVATDSVGISGNSGGDGCFACALWTGEQKCLSGSFEGFFELVLEV